MKRAWACAAIALIASGCGGGGSYSPAPAPAPMPPTPMPPIAPAPPLLPDPEVRISAPSTFATGCTGTAGAGTNYVNAEVEPHVAINPINPANLIAAWQQDRWSNGGASGNAGAVSFDGGAPPGRLRRHRSRAAAAATRRQRRQLRACNRPVGHLRRRRHRLPDGARVQRRVSEPGFDQRDAGVALDRRWSHLEHV